MTEKMTRRTWGASVLSTAAAYSVGRAVSAAPTKQGWIDSHVHVWTPDTKRYPLDPKFKVSDMQPRSFTPEELFQHTKPVGVDRVVLIQMSFYRFDNSYMLDCISAHPGVFSGVGIVDHHQRDVGEKMKELAKAGVRGFRLHPEQGEAARWASDEGMNRVWKVASDEGLAVCPLINAVDLPHVDAMCAKYPKARVVFDHFARVGITGTIEPSELDSLCRLARFPHTHVKVSAFYALGKKQSPHDDLIPMIRRVVDAFGPDRLMWASDAPYQVQPPHRYADSVALIRDRIDFLSENDKQAILRGTAEKVFFS